MAEININQLAVDMDRKKIAMDYQIFELITSKPYISTYAKILDAPFLCKKVCAIFFDSGNDWKGKSLFVMAYKSVEDTATAIRQSIANTEDVDYVTIKEKDIEDTQAVSKKVLVSLLLNALGTYKNKDLRFNNLTGHLYYINPNNPKLINMRTSQKDTKWIKQLYSLEIAVKEEPKGSDVLYVDLNVYTFTSIRLAKDMGISSNKKGFYTIPRYKWENKALKRELSNDKTDCFVKRQLSGTRTTIPFMDIQNKEHYHSSKMGILVEVIERFNKKYKGLCQIDFVPFSSSKPVSSPKKIVRENTKAVKELLENNPIKIVDLIGDENSSELCKNIKKCIETKYGVSAGFGKRVSKKHLNICVLHNSTWYNEHNVNDPYNKDQGCAVQHVTLEDFSKNDKNEVVDKAVSTILHELLVKKDLENRHINIFKWEEYKQDIALEEDITFAICKEQKTDDKKNYRYFFMTVHSDGSFEDPVEQRYDCEDKKFYDCYQAFTENKEVSELIRFSNGDINMIRNTAMYAIPEIFELEKKLQADETNLRSKDSREEFLAGVTDIRVFEKNDKVYYYVGVIGDGMQSKVNHAANIRAIEPYKDSSIHTKEILPLMNVPFVRNGQLTVIPFPFKYLREWIASLPDVEEDTEE